MMVIGITGGIGSGKSTASEYLIDQGFVSIDADQIGRDLTAEGQPLLEKIGERFGCVSQTGTIGNGLVLDRKAMADLVFGDSKVKKQFDELVHGEIIAVIDAKIAELSKTDARGILLDAPLLFEAHIDDRCDKVILVTADIDKRIERVCMRDGSEPDAIRARISNQMSDEEKAERSDFVVDNSGGLEDLYRQLDHVTDYLGI